MLRHILLLLPVFVSSFWAFALNSGSENENKPRLFLGKFMIFVCLVYVSHFLFFEPFRALYSYIDPIYQLAMLLVFPIYYIYVRLLTADAAFSLKRHSRYIILPVGLFVLYCVGILITPVDEYNSWIFHRNLTSPTLFYIKIIYSLIRITFLVEVIMTIIGNNVLVRKYELKARQYYADIEDGSVWKIRVLNTAMIIISCCSFILGMLGRDFFDNELIGIAIVSVIFSSMLFVIGWLGNKQDTINPNNSLEPETDTQTQPEELSIVCQNEILRKILFQFDERKFHLQNRATIQDLAQAVGTNRSYISATINKQFNLNFCCFVNNYRLQEVEKIIDNFPSNNFQQLAETCGFGSIDSLKRAVKSKYGLTLFEWKKQRSASLLKNIKDTC